ncbi:SKP1-like protein 1A [Alnus glutinosa]|uniref:SKP1-like protein 1A n=1 Tax=Alnus glutinosa TaxID=3517 RepID=UPI002D76B879|nr:SKP1-like protein 1A [Alnus glutinosa]
MSSTPSSSCAKKITLRCSDGQTFEVEKAVAQKLLAIKRMIDDGFADDVIPLPNVTGPILARVINYHEKHGQTARPSDGSSVLPASLDAAPQEQEIQEWDADFVNVNPDTLIDLTLAANYLESQELLDLTCRAVADQIKRRSVEEIREFFNIDNDYTPEEEEEERSNIKWAFETEN